MRAIAIRIAAVIAASIIGCNAGAQGFGGAPAGTVNSTRPAPVGSADRYPVKLDDASRRQAEAARAGDYPELSRIGGGQIQEAWNNSTPGDGVYRVATCRTCVTKIRTREFMVTYVKLPAGEHIKTVDIGDNSAFQVELRGTQMIAMKPTHFGVDTNLMIVAHTGNVYPLYVRAESYNSKNIPDVMVMLTGGDLGDKIEAKPPQVQTSPSLGDAALGSQRVPTHKMETPGSRSEEVGAATRDLENGSPTEATEIPYEDMPVLVPDEEAEKLNDGEISLLLYNSGTNYPADRIVARPLGEIGAEGYGIRMDAPREREDRPSDFVRTVGFDVGELHGWNDYRVYGNSPRLKPDRIFRDRHFTYLQWDDWQGEFEPAGWDSAPLPAAYVIVSGIDELVNTRVTGRTFIVETIADFISLKLGEEFICIVYGELNDSQKESEIDGTDGRDR